MKRIFTAFMMMLCAACVASAANYLTFTAAEDGSSFGIKNTNNNPDVQYSLDDGATWNLLTDGESIPLAKKGDTILLLGKGHESTIIYKDGPIPWDERTAAENALKKLR